MTKTDLTFTPGCHNGATTYTDQLDRPTAIFQIRTQSCLVHDNHLIYTDTNGDHHYKVYVAQLSVPADKVKITIKWRSGISEILKCSPEAGRIVDRSVAGETSYIFDVPNAGELDWTIDNGSPGFHLAVKVKRKA